MHKVRTQYNYFTFPEVKKTKLKEKDKFNTYKLNPQITIQGLDTSVFSMLQNGLTDEGETKKGNYTENLLVNAFTDELEFETQFEKEYNRQFFDNLNKSVVDDAETLSAKNEPSNETAKNATTTEQNGATEQTGA